MRALVWALCGTCLCAAARAGTLEAPIQTRTLPNGLTVVLAPDAGAAGVHVAMWYRVGSRDDRPGRTGLAYLTERLTARGATVAERALRLQAAGAALGSLTTADYTCFQSVLPAEQLELAFQLEAARMAALSATEGDLDTLRAQAVADARQRAVQPGAHGLDRLYEVAFTRHPYRQPVSGRAEDLQAITLEECAAFHRAHYVPAAAVLTVTGAFQPGEATRLARKYLGALPRRPAPRRTQVEEPVQQSERRAEDRLAANAPLLFMAWRAPADSSRDAPALELAAGALLRGRTARLTQRLVEGGRGVLAVQGAFDGREEAGLFYMAAAVSPEADRATVERAVAEEVEGLGVEALPNVELEKSRNQSETTWLLNWQSVQNRGQWLGQGAIRFDDPRAALRRLEALGSLTPEEVRRAAASYLAASRRTVVWVVPEPQPVEGEP